MTEILFQEQPVCKASGSLARDVYDMAFIVSVTKQKEALTCSVAFGISVRRFSANRCAVCPGKANLQSR